MVNYVVYLMLSLFTNIQDVKYAEALKLIIDSEEYKEFKVDNDSYGVSNEILDFDVFGWAFCLESESILVDNEVKEINNDLVKLNTKKRDKARIFFSEERNGIFFAELFSMQRKFDKYSDRPDFGRSYVFMFRNENDSLKLIKVDELHYN